MMIMVNPLQEHWNTVYATKDEKELSWHQEKALPSLRLLAQTSLALNDCIVDVGSGTTVFIRDLLQRGFTNIIAVDISAAALRKAQEKLEKLQRPHTASVTFIVDDIIHPTRIHQLRNGALWHDRAVFHFLTKKDDQRAYLETLNTVLKRDGFVIMGTFSLDAPEQCSGLPVVRYTPELLLRCFGTSYTLKESCTYVHTTPSGTQRPFTYILLQKIR